MDDIKLYSLLPTNNGCYNCSYRTDVSGTLSNFSYCSHPLNIKMIQKIMKTNNVETDNKNTEERLTIGPMHICGYWKKSKTI